MKKCPSCKIDMIIIQDDSPHPYSWGGFRLYGCQNCHMVYYQHLDSEGRESKQLTEDEVKRMQPKIEETKKESGKKSSKIPALRRKDLKRIMKNIDKKFLDETKKKKKWIHKPMYDPMHHHDSHVYN